MLKENPVAGFWANRLPPRPRDEVVVVAVVLVLDGAAPRPPKLKPLDPAAGALKDVETISHSIEQTYKKLSIYI